MSRFAVAKVSPVNIATPQEFSSRPVYVPASGKARKVTKLDVAFFGQHEVTVRGCNHLAVVNAELFNEMIALFS